VDHRHEQQLGRLAMPPFELAHGVVAPHGYAPLVPDTQGPQARAAGTSVGRSTKEFRNFTDAISMLSMISVVLVCSTAWMTRKGTAVIGPKAVQFMASEMLADSRLAFSAGFTDDTALKAPIRPISVPSRPSSVARFAKVAR